VQFAHTLSWGITFALLTNVSQYIWRKCDDERDPPHLRRFAPFYLTALAVPLVMLDLTRHVMADAGVATLPMYRANCKEGNSSSLWANIECLSVYGWTFTIMGTWSGYACLIVGVLWATGIAARVRSTWRNLRGSPLYPINSAA